MWQPLRSDGAEKADVPSKSNRNNNTNVSESQDLDDVIIDEGSNDLTAPTSPVINVDYVGK
jgi:predicted P-loop ATPase/GTPase